MTVASVPAGALVRALVRACTCADADAHVRTVLVCKCKSYTYFLE
ncbi:hypothetical protein GCM10010913_04450 [Paenibacillus aceti]|uniref:Uncharacterized protein n=1 Tax=Paenibacillus aceti TaxID=1820010 RepID=A0ABQ1VPK8_9BACL|nr:hypothetical protein GCM10010913_04450 [Paenibacillus aceti]